MCVRCACWMRGFVRSKASSPKIVDFVVIRENTEGVYGDLGGVFKQGTPDEIAIQEDINTRKGVERVIRYAFEYCDQQHRRLMARIAVECSCVTNRTP